MGSGRMGPFEASKQSEHTVNFLSLSAPYFEQYLTLERVHPTRQYNYEKRKLFGYPVIEVTRHGPKCRIGDSWLYVAIPSGADLASLGTEDKLYVGAQTQDRMFRGDGLAGDNYHHKEMRDGNGHDNPVTFLQSGKRIEIRRISEALIARVVTQFAELAFLDPLLRQPRTRTTHTGYWFEQFILYKEPRQWRWNTASANKAVAVLIDCPG